MSPSAMLTACRLTVPTELTAHLVATLGVWPPTGGTVRISTSPARVEPGWDGKVLTAVGLDTPHGSVLSVPPWLFASAPNGLPPQHARAWLARHLPEERLQPFVYRWAGPHDPVAALDDVGQWTQPGGVVPPWLRPLNGGALIATIEGRYAAAVGIKRHDDHVHEIAVVTAPDHRGRGLARRLVAQATRAIHDGGAVALYLHAPDNVASRQVADAVGFPDRHWELLTTGT